MSQITSYIVNGTSGSGPVMTLTGNSGGAVAPNGAANINVVADTQASTIPPTGFTFIGNQVANTLTFEQFNYSAVTVGATSSVIFTLPMATNSSVQIRAEVVALRDDKSSGGCGFVVGGATRAAGAPTVLEIGFNMLDNEALGSLETRLEVSGNDLIVFVSGIAGTTFDWSAYVRYTVIT